VCVCETMISDAEYSEKNIFDLIVIF